MTRAFIACFNVCTGDIGDNFYYINRKCTYLNATEDAPAPSALHSFKAHVSNGKIYVTANPAHTLNNNKARQSKLLSSGTDSVGKGLIIVGGGAAAFHTVESLREVCIVSNYLCHILTSSQAWILIVHHASLERDTHAH